MDMSETPSGIVKREDGFFWPADDAWCHKVIHSELPDLDAAIGLTKGRTLAVQAGGNVGVWASRLAAHFATVYTFEPDATNYECLKRNVPLNVKCQQAGLGAEPGRVGMALVQGNAGAHYLSGPGPIPIVTIDSLDLTTCDLLILDVEGSEPAALRGAEQTIRQYRPVIMFEEKGLSERYYNIKRGTAEEFLKGLGYRVANRVRADVIMVPVS
jgi:FkbM family methyltransferase